MVIQMNKQRNVLISYLLYYGGFFISILSIVIILIYSILFNHHEVDIIHLLCFIAIICGIIFPNFASRFNLYFYFGARYPGYKTMKSFCIDENRGFIQGVPNNKASEFLKRNMFDLKAITLYKENGIYFDINKNISIDMKGWLLKDKYVYELIETFYKVEYINKNKLDCKKIYKSISDKKIKEKILVIYSKNIVKTYTLSYDGKIKSRINLNIKNKKKFCFFDSKKLSIYDFYSFKK